ncbi:hypothetical protein RhiirA4_543038 [Rhizophagus irregularis]|uniref:Uncharacterized protein n=1 Tax=Rhizophagus irregularis TaxID=588596 RepID=A0A2I1GHF2_9GLOM|nr:hypothetical protein RhiirA4_543038 [Rhizophagus irregularis]
MCIEESEEETNEEVVSQSDKVEPEALSHDDSDCSHDSDSEEEMPNDSDDGYDGYGGYNEYGERDRVRKMVRKKNKRHNQSTSSATSSSVNETQSKNMIVSDTELRELIRQGLVVDEVHEVLSYDRKNMP